METPGVFQQIKPPDFPLEMDFRLHLDMLEMNFYFGFGVEYPDMTGKDAELDFYERLLKNWDQDGTMEILSTEAIQTTGVDGYRFETKTAKGAYACWQVYVRDGMVNIFAVWQEEEGDQASYAQFFESIQLPPLVLPPPPELLNFKSEEGAFSINVTREPLYRWVQTPDEVSQGEAPRSLRAHVYTTIGQNVVMMFRYHDYSRGKYAQNPKQDLEIQIEALYSYWGEPIDPLHHHEFIGYPALETAFLVENSKLFTRMIFKRETGLPFVDSNARKFS